MKKRFLVTMLLSLTLTMTTAESLTIEKPIPRKPVITSPHLLQQQAKVEKIKQTREGKEIFTLVEYYSGLYKVDHKLVKAVILAESGYFVHARSSANAQGLMQLMSVHKGKVAGCNDLFNKKCNVAIGTKHLAGLLAKYKGNEEKALSAYNAGGGNVDKSLRKNGQIPSYTKSYVTKVKSYKVLFE